LARPLAAEAIQELRIGAARERQGERQGERQCACYRSEGATS
jgi:hypothetical protein